MSINPGVGYTLNAGSGSFNLTVNPQFVNYDSDGGSAQPTDVNVPPGQLATQTTPPIQLAPWQMVVVNVNGTRYLRIVQGTASYTESNMPAIQTGYQAVTRQALFTKAQICPSGMRTTSVYPGAGQDPYPLNKWLEGANGGFELYDTNNPLTLYAFKWDVAPGSSPFSDSAIVNTGRPTLAILSGDNTGDYNKINVAAGPSIYEQTTNVQKMSGYDAASTEMAGDWGYCHTTWVNPRKFGYALEAIGTLNPVANTFGCTISTVQVGVPGLTNAVQEIRFTGTGNGFAYFTFSYVTIVDGEPVTISQTSTVPFNVDDMYSSLGVVRSDEFALANSLNSIPGLVGNFAVSKAGPGLFYVTFVNKLQQQPMILMTANIGGVTAPSYNFEVVQYATGCIDLTNEGQSGMNQLMDESGKTEADDPYNLNKDGTPPWKDISNRAKVIACDGFSGDVTTDGVYPMFDGEGEFPSFFLAGSCSAGGCDFPFQVKHDGVVAEEDTYTVCSGAVNNQIPINITDTLALAGAGYVWLKIPYDSTNKVFPMADSITVEIGATPPYSDGDYSYVWVAHVNAGVVNQLITGSLWGDRIQLGSGEYASAQYYFAKV